MLATELGTSKQTLYLERETSRNLARKVEQLQAVESRVAVMEAQLAQSRAKAAEAEQASEQATVICDELRQQKTFLEVQLVDAQAPGSKFVGKLRNGASNRFTSEEVSNLLLRARELSGFT